MFNKPRNTLIFASNSSSKLKDFQYFFNLYDINVENQNIYIGDVEAVEDGNTLIENCLKKLNLCKVELFKRNIVNRTFFADDSGVFIPELPNICGVNTAEYITNPEGVRDSIYMIDKLRNELLKNNINPLNPIYAEFRCCIALYNPKLECPIVIVEKTLKGNICLKIDNKTYESNVFGFNQIFYPMGVDTSLHNMNRERLKLYSPRLEAIKAIHLLV